MSRKYKSHNHGNYRNAMQSSISGDFAIKSDFILGFSRLI